MTTLEFKNAKSNTIITAEIDGAHATYSDGQSHSIIIAPNPSDPVYFGRAYILVKEDGAYKTLSMATEITAEIVESLNELTGKSLLFKVKSPTSKSSKKADQVTAPKYSTIQDLARYTARDLCPKALYAVSIYGARGNNGECAINSYKSEIARLTKILDQLQDFKAKADGYTDEEYSQLIITAIEKQQEYDQAKRAKKAKADERKRNIKKLMDILEIDEATAAGMYDSKNKDNEVETEQPDNDSTQIFEIVTKITD